MSVLSSRWRDRASGAAILLSGFARFAADDRVRVKSMANGRHVALGTVSFTVCFAAWGLIGAFAPRFRETFHLTASETALLVAVPVLLGSLARLLMGILTDRYGGRAIFSVLMAAVAGSVLVVAQQAAPTRVLVVPLFSWVFRSSLL